MPLLIQNKNGDLRTELFLKHTLENLKKKKKTL